MVKRIIFWGTAACGVAAAVLMYKRGASVGDIAKRAGLHPISSLVGELRGNNA